MPRDDDMTGGWGSCDPAPPLCGPTGLLGLPLLIGDLSSQRRLCRDLCLEQSIMGRVAFLYKGMGDISKGYEFESQV